MTSLKNEPLIVDAAIAARLERTEAMANSQFVEARKRLSPESNAAWIEVAGAYCMFDGTESPCTQTFGLGMNSEPTSADFDKIELFFTSRGAQVHHEVAPLISTELLNLLSSRKYRPVEFTNVLCRRIDPAISMPINVSPNLTVKVATPADAETWAQTSSQGWAEFPGVAEMILDLARIYAATEGATAMIVEAGGKPIATGVVAIAEGVALLAGASTIPEARNQGAQSALLAHRLQFAAQQGCDIAMMCALPSSPSQRNAQRNGFQIAYTRTKWKLDSGQRQASAVAEDVPEHKNVNRQDTSESGELHIEYA